MVQVEIHAGAWRVLRHGGRRRDSWRALYEGQDEARARRVYAREGAQLRQGCVALVGPDGQARAQRYAPCLRSRW